MLLDMGIGCGLMRYSCTTNFTCIFLRARPRDDIVANSESLASNTSRLGVVHWDKTQNRVDRITD